MDRIEIKRLKNYKIFIERNLIIYKKSKYKSLIKNILVRLSGLIGTALRLHRQARKIDILFILNCNKTNERIRPIIEYINEALDIEVEIRRNILKNIISLKLGIIPLNIPVLLTDEYSEARYYSEIYDPKVIVLLENESILSSFLKHFTHAKIVNIAHGVRTNLVEHSNINYDYYLIYGKSSLVHMKNNPYLFGNTVPVITGSPFIKNVTKKCNENYKIQSVIYFSQYQNKRVKDYLSFSNNIFIKFAIKNPYVKCIVKPHPLENTDYWLNLVKGIHNIQIVDSKVDIFDILKPGVVSVVAWSNAALESALVNCPIISIDGSGFADNNLDISKYFPVVTSVSEFECALDAIQKNYLEYQEVCKKFVNYHLGYTNDSYIKVAETIINILKGEYLSHYSLTENINWNQ